MFSSGFEVGTSSEFSERGAAGLGHPEYPDGTFETKSAPPLSETERQIMLDKFFGRVVVVEPFEK